MTSALLAALRLAAGPAALVGFFLPWAEGPGALASVDFSGYSLVGFTGHLWALDLGPGGTAALLAVRLAVLSVGVAALLHAVAAAGLRWHPAYRVTGWWLVMAAPGALLLSTALSGELAPRAGTALLAGGAVSFVTGEAASRLWLFSGKARADLVQQLG